MQRSHEIHPNLHQLFSSNSLHTVRVKGERYETQVGGVCVCVSRLTASTGAKIDPDVAQSIIEHLSPNIRVLDMSGISFLSRFDVMSGRVLIL